MVGNQTPQCFPSSPKGDIVGIMTCVVLDGNLLDEVCQHDPNRMILQASTHVTESLGNNISVQRQKNDEGDFLINTCMFCEEKMHTYVGM